MEPIVHGSTDTSQRAPVGPAVPRVHPRSPRSTARRGTRRMAKTLRELIPRALGQDEATAAMLDGVVAPEWAVVVWNVADKPVLQEVCTFAIPESGDLLPVRRIGTHPEAPNRVSHFATVRDGQAIMLEAESRLEMHHLRATDMEPGVTWLHTQPLVLVWPLDGAAIIHIPDILAKHWGRPIVIDVKPDELTTDYHRLTFSLTQASLALGGVEHRVAGSVTAQSETNHIAVRRYKIIDPTLAEAVVDVVSQRPATAFHLLRICGDPKIGREVFFHLLANGRCRIAMDRPIHRTTQIDWVIEE